MASPSLSEIVYLESQIGWDPEEMRRRLGIAGHVPDEMNFAIYRIAGATDCAGWPFGRLREMFCCPTNTTSLWEAINRALADNRDYLSALGLDLWHALDAAKRIREAPRRTAGMCEERKNTRAVQMLLIKAVQKEGAALLATLEKLADLPIYEIPSALDDVQLPHARNLIAILRSSLDDFSKFKPDPSTPSVWLAEAVLDGLALNKPGAPAILFIRLLTTFFKLVTKTPQLGATTELVRFFFPEFRNGEEEELRKTISRESRRPWLDPSMGRIVVTPTGSQLHLKEPPTGLAPGRYLKAPSTGESRSPRKDFEVTPSPP